jgi:hypothetical protein
MAYENPPETPLVADGDRSAQAHRDWLSQCVTAFDMIQRFLFDLVNNEGEQDGVVLTNDWPAGGLEPDVTSPESMRVTVAGGWAFLDGDLLKGYGERQTSDELVAPVAEDRIDTVAIDAASGLIVIHTGAEAEVPSAPAVDAGEIEVAQIDMRVGMSAIYATDVTGDGYLRDTRVVVNP